MVSQDPLDEIPIFLYGTGGLRMLDDPRQDILLATIRSTLVDYPFSFQYNWCEIIPSKKESLFDWITAQQTLLIQRNYGDSLDVFASVTDGKSSISYSSDQTVGIIDIGGASVEIAFEPDASTRKHRSADLHCTNSFSDDDLDGIGCIHHADTLYQVYSRGFEMVGHKEFQVQYQKQLYHDDSYFIQNQSDGHIFDDPCGLLDALLPARFNGTYELPIYFLGKLNFGRRSSPISTRRW